ncbi:hypothetical protein M8C21_024349 [Ambrosia artemisiifolia]|uniref:HSF-type DNA-binding domain-containing protein n=1 Tax=Ambrosia artemisiifolia TaxID=4212 RepID=A0AAD5CTE3_AMBAR|nr:hypothetical protein M8C21_024349 [Ambrosia artemisiifolia]
MTHRSAPAPFLSKTYSLVDDPTTDDVISWNESGTTFVVWKTADFAKDLLPNSFKHNNFSSFVRQLNTYGFRKTVPDKWEFANENFKRGQRELLLKICRRKTVTTSQSPTNGKPADNDRPTSSPTSSELAQMKKQCDDLVAFLTQNVNVAPDQINRIMNGDIVVDDTKASSDDESNDDDDEKRNSFKLFGVLVKEEKKKRGRDEINDSLGAKRKEMKMNKFNKSASEMNVYAITGQSTKFAVIKFMSYF